MSIVQRCRPDSSPFYSGMSYKHSSRPTPASSSPNHLAHYTGLLEKTARIRRKQGAKALIARRHVSSLVLVAALAALTACGAVFEDHPIADTVVELFQSAF